MNEYNALNGPKQMIGRRQNQITWSPRCFKVQRVSGQQAGVCAACRSQKRPAPCAARHQSGPQRLRLRGCPGPSPTLPPTGVVGRPADLTSPPQRASPPISEASPPRRVPRQGFCCDAAGVGWARLAAPPPAPKSRISLRTNSRIVFARR